VGLFVKVHQSEPKGPLLFSSQVATWYYQSNHSKVEAIPLSALNTISELAGLSSHYPFFTWTSRREALNTNF